MPRSCTVCTSPLRALADGRLLAGHALADVAREVGVGRQALARHRDSHIGRNAAARSAATEIDGDDFALPTPPAGFNDRLQGLIDQAVELMKIARESGDVRGALQAIRDIRAIVDSQVRIAEIAAANPTIGLDGQPSCIVILPDNGRRNEEPDPDPPEDTDDVDDDGVDR